jgi:hypothetical protein
MLKEAVPIVATAGGVGGGSGRASMTAPIDPERRLAAEIRDLLSKLASKMDEARKLDMRVTFNVGIGSDGVYVSEADIVKVID